MASKVVRTEQQFEGKPFASIVVQDDRKLFVLASTNAPRKLVVAANKALSVAESIAIVNNGKATTKAPKGGTILRKTRKATSEG